MMHGDPSLRSDGQAADYTDENGAKADFDDVYTAPTPHAYLRAMYESDYGISEETRPFFSAAVELLRRRNGVSHVVQMLDVGCSYGVGAATVKFGCTFPEMAAFSAGRAPEDYRRCVESTRVWLHATPPRFEVRVVGLDTSEPALRFARDASMIQGAIASDFEAEQVLPDDEERAWLAGCNLSVSSGAIGYVTARTFSKIIPEVGTVHAGHFGPLAVFSILRMFDPEPIRQTFEACRWRFGRVPRIHLPQSEFADPREREEVFVLLDKRDLDPEGLESTGVLYADLFAAAPGAEYDDLYSQMRAVAKRRDEASC